MRFTRRSIAGALLTPLALALAVPPAWAGERPYTRAALDAALASGQPVVVHFRASWCPTCKAQKPLVDALLAEPRRKELTLFAADFDTESALEKALRVTQQSTFVVYKAGKEVGRSTGETRKSEIAALFDKAL